MFGELERRLTTKLYDHANQFTVFLFLANNSNHIFRRERLKIQAVRGIVVGRNRLRVAVNHDGFIPCILQGIGRMYTAIIKLNPLPYAVRPTTKDDNFFAIGWVALT